MPRTSSALSMTGGSDDPLGYATSDLALRTICHSAKS
jgi:hypothetical protein